MKIPDSKLQTPNKFQFPNAKTLDFGFCDLDFNSEGVF